MNRYSMDYWNKEFFNHFKNRDRLSENSYFVIAYNEAPAPSFYTFHTIMNFNNFDKMVSYIKYVCAVPAVAEALEIEDNENAYSVIEEIFNDKSVFDNLDDIKKQAVLNLVAFDHVLEDTADVKLEHLTMFVEAFNEFFRTNTDSVYGIELVLPGDDLVEFWEEFFMLDNEDEDDLEELEMVRTAVETDNFAMLCDAISEH